MPPGFGQNAPPPAERKLNVNTDEAFFIYADVDKTEVYEGEQVTVSWYIYTRGQMETLDRLKFPSLKGFWKEIIEEVPALRFEDEIVNGVMFRKALLASHALFPIKPGLIAIDEFKVKSRLRLPSRTGLTQPYEYTRSSKRIEVRVKPLPSENRPKSFSGAVGEFQVRAYLENQNVFLNQPFTLKVRFEGSGNAKLIELPELTLPPSFTVYDTKSDSRFFKNGTSFKEFNVVIVPKELGHFTVAPIEFSMFNVKTKEYEIRRSEALVVDVNPGQPQANQGEQKFDAQKPSSPVSNELLPVPSANYSRWASLSPASSASRFFVHLALYLLALIALLIKAVKELSKGQRRKDFRQSVAQRLAKIESGLSKKNPRDLGAEVTNLYYFALGEVSGLGGANQEIRRLLEEAPASLRREYADSILQNFEFFQMLTFAPEDMIAPYSEPQRVEAEFKKAKALFKRMADSFSEIRES